jgi:transcriptional regulator of acetoin/glycerol metabolism
MNKLEAAVEVVYLIKKTNPIDSVIIVVDRQGNVLAHSGSEFMSADNKKSLPKQSAAYQCMEKRETLAYTLPKHVLGVKIKAKATPIFDNEGEAIGAMVISENADKQERLHNAAQTVAATSDEMAVATQELGNSSIKVAEEIDKIKQGGEQVLAKLDQTEDILKFVIDVATNSNLLGLNAAIEAARAGEQGRGFAVVADEIRKMAANSAASVNKIKKILRDIHNDTTLVIKSIVSTAEHTSHQASATEELAATMQVLATTASDIEEISKDI